MNVNLEIASLIAILPGLFFLYYVWGKYEGVLNDKSVIFYLIIGFIFGAPSGAIYLWLRFYSANVLLLDVLYLGVLFPFFIVFFVLIFMNRKGMVSHYETMFYTMALFLGIGSMLSTTVIYKQISDVINISGFPVYILYSCGNALISMSAGFMVGYGIYTGSRVYALIQALMTQIIYNVLVVLSYMNGMNIIMLSLGLFISAVIYLNTLNNVHFSIPKEVRRELRRQAHE